MQIQIQPISGTQNVNCSAWRRYVLDWVLFELLPWMKDSERVLHLGPSVCLATQNFRVFLRNRLSDRDEIFTIGATTHEECFIDNYDVIGHVVWQPFWKNRKKLDLYLKPHQGKNWNLALSKSYSWGISVIFIMSWLPSLWRHNCIHRTLHLISMKNLWGSSWDKMVHRKKIDDIISHIIRQPYEK